MIQDTSFTYLRKPHGIPSTFGNQECFLDLLENSDPTTQLWIRFSEQKKIFSREEEYGLVNRLDNDTAGLLYFAHSSTIKTEYKNLQSQGQIFKCYTASVYGQIQAQFFEIHHPLAHHATHADRMVVLNPWSTEDIRGKSQSAHTYCELINYDANQRISHLRIRIPKGVRHQIRAHLADYGYSMVGEQLYISPTMKKSVPKTFLHLRSMGLTTSLPTYFNPPDCPILSKE